MNQFTGIFLEATAAIAREYFLLPVHNADSVFRERVYCYELYHQMRARWPEDCPYFLNGEVDKQQHPYFQHGFPKPDYLVHIPGTGDNHAVIEVKSRAATADQIRDDLRKLVLFRTLREYPYQRALYLFYGIDPETARARVLASAENEEQLAVTELWVHEHVSEP